MQHSPEYVLRKQNPFPKGFLQAKQISQGFCEAKGLSKKGFDLSISIAVPKKEAGIFLKAIGPELNAVHAKRSATHVKIKNNAVQIGINASDATALRASVNSIVNSIILSKSILEE